MNKQLDLKNMLILTNNYNTDITQYYNAMKSGQIIEYNERSIIFFFRIHPGNITKGPVPDLFFYKGIYEVKASDLQVSFNILR